MGKRQVRNYTEDFKRSSAKLAVESDRPISTTAHDLGVNQTTLHGWVKRYYPNKADSGRSDSDGHIDPHEEIKQLKKEIARLKMERDILKKATAYFASDTL